MFNLNTAKTKINLYELNKIKQIVVVKCCNDSMTVFQILVQQLRDSRHYVNT